MTKNYFFSYAYQAKDEYKTFGFGNLEFRCPTIKGMEDINNIHRRIARDLGLARVTILNYKVI